MNYHVQISGYQQPHPSYIILRSSLVIRSNRQQVSSPAFPANPAAPLRKLCTVVQAPSYSIDHAVGGLEGAVAMCEKLVEAGGLKTTFSLFAKKPSAATIEHLLGIFAALLRWLPGESAARIRTLHKFMEKNGEKVAKLVEMRKDFSRRMSAVEDEVKLERRMMDEEDWAEREAEWLSRRLEGGLFGLQTTDVVLAWLVAEDLTAKKIVADGLGGLQSVRASLVEQAEGADDEETKEVLGTLIEFLE